MSFYHGALKTVYLLKVSLRCNVITFLDQIPLHPWPHSPSEEFSKIKQREFFVINTKYTKQN